MPNLVSTIRLRKLTFVDVFTFSFIVAGYCIVEKLFLHSPIENGDTKSIKNNT